MIPYLTNTYITSEGDMVENLCYKHYGKWDVEVMKKVWQANPWVLHRHMLLPAGRILILPAIDQSTLVLKTIPMWKDEPVKVKKNTASLITMAPAAEYEGRSLTDYLEDYRRNKATYREERFVTLEQSSQPLYGTVVNTENEVYRYTPQAGFSGVDRFQLRATDGEVIDTDTVEIVVLPSGSVNRFEIFGNAAKVDRISLLMFCATRRTQINSIQVGIVNAEGPLVQSHSAFANNNFSYADVTVQKRMSNGGVMAWGSTVRLANSIRTGAIIPSSGNFLNVGECLVAHVPAVNGNVWGLYVDVNSNISEQ